jgi:ferredoxin-fold anticodon binding domain-containing protein
MNKLIMLVVIIIIALTSCSESRSGNRESKMKVARVRILNDNTVNWIRLNTVEAQVYQVGDTIKMSNKTHMVSGMDSDYQDYMLVRLDSIMDK